MAVNNFLTIESDHGQFIVNRHCAHQAEVLIKTGKPHIQDELNKVLAVVNTLPAGCVLVDAGANIGLLAIPMAQLIANKGGMLHAFEPQRMMAYALCGGVALNDLSNVIVHNKALGERTGYLKASMPDYSQPQDFGQFSLVNSSSNMAENIELTTIDALALSRLDFLKADVEGMEIDLLKGAANTIKIHRPWCWIEYWKLNIDDIKAQFSNLNYHFYMMDELNLLCAPVDKLEAAPLNINAKQV